MALYDRALGAGELAAHFAAAREKQRQGGIGILPVLFGAHWSVNGRMVHANPSVPPPGRRPGGPPSPQRRRTDCQLVPRNARSLAAGGN